MKIGILQPCEFLAIRHICHYSTVSLDKFRAKFNPFLDTPYVLHKKDVSVKDGVVYLPLYMAPLLVSRM